MTPQEQLSQLNDDQLKTAYYDIFKHHLNPFSRQTAIAHINQKQIANASCCGKTPVQNNQNQTIQQSNRKSVTYIT